MSTPHDLSNMNSAPAPSIEELDASEYLIEELRAGRLEFTTDPALRLLGAARGPAAAAELIDGSGFVERVVMAAPCDPTAQLRVVDERSGAAGHRQLGLLGRMLAAKAAVIAAIGIVSVAGAGAATGVAIASHHRSDPPVTSVPATPVTTEAAPASEPDAPDGATSAATPDDPATSGSATSTVPAVTTVPPDATTVAPGVTPTPAGPAGSNVPAGQVPSTTPPAERSARGAEQPAPPERPTSNGNGTKNGNSPNAGGNPDPGSNGAANGASANAGGKANNGLGAVNGNGAARSGEPAEPAA